MRRAGRRLRTSRWSTRQEAAAPARLHTSQSKPAQLNSTGEATADASPNSNNPPLQHDAAAPADAVAALGRRLARCKHESSCMLG